jgi:hypothetical protein
MFFTLLVVWFLFGFAWILFVTLCIIDTCRYNGSLEITEIQRFQMTVKHYGPGILVIICAFYGNGFATFM